MNTAVMEEGPVTTTSELSAVQLQQACDLAAGYAISDMGAAVGLGADVERRLTVLDASLEEVFFQATAAAES